MLGYCQYYSKGNKTCVKFFGSALEISGGIQNIVVPQILFFDSPYAIVTYMHFEDYAVIFTAANYTDQVYSQDISSDLPAYPYPNNGIFNVKFNLNKVIPTFSVSTFDMPDV
jgi:hypothetical protein